jgi:hypothetical protein
MASFRVLAVALLAGVAWGFGQPSTGERRDWKPFEELVRSGLAAKQTSFLPSPAICPGPVPNDVRQQLIAQIPKRLETYFAESQLGKEISLAFKVVQEKEGPACLYGGGVDWVRLDEVTVNNESAGGTGQARLWTKVAQWQEKPVMAEPHNTINMTFQFARVDGRWMISTYDWKFAPGSEP